MMGDQMRWWKLWASALEDADLEALSLEDFARWVRLGAWLRLHGENGAATLRRPGRALAKVWRTPRWDTLIACARRLPGITLEVLAESPDGQPATIRIGMTNWKKYQVDSSAERTRRWREKQRSGDGPQPSHGDAYPPSHQSSHQSSRVTVQEERGGINPPTPLTKGGIVDGKTKGAGADWRARWGKIHTPVARLHPEDQAKLERGAHTWPPDQVPPDLCRVWFTDGVWTFGGGPKIDP